MPLLRSLRPELTADDVLRAQAADPASIRARRPGFVEVAERALAEGMPLLEPAVLYQRFPVAGLRHERMMLNGGGVLSGPLVARHLAGSTEVAVAVCSIGRRLEERVAAVIGSDWTYGLALDGVGSAAAEALAEAACRHLDEQAALEGQKTTTPINPGLDGWPVLEGQQQIFQLVNAPEIGLELLPTGLMLPVKSVSFVVGIGAGVSGGSAACDYCGMRERCRYRAA